MMTLSILYSVNFIGSLICLHADMNKQDNKFNLNNFNFFLSNTYFTCKQIRHLVKFISLTLMTYPLCLSLMSF